MAKTGSQKICVICGDDCSAMARVKDSHGRYYHKSCHEEAAAKQQKRRANEARKPGEVGEAGASGGGSAKAASEPPTAMPLPRPVEIESPEPRPATVFSAEPLVDPEDSSLGMDDDLRLAESGSMMPIEKDSRAVPKPTAPRKVDRPASPVEDPYAIVQEPKKRAKSAAPKPPAPPPDPDPSKKTKAVARGEVTAAAQEEFDPFAELAKELDAAPAAVEVAAPATMSKPAKVKKPPKVKGAGGAVWPIVVGVISILLGGGGLLFIVAGWVSAFSSGGAGPGTVGGVIPALLAAMLAIGGVRILRRQQSGASLLVRWAWIKGSLTVVCGGAILIMADAASGQIAAAAGMTEQEAAEMGGNFMTAMILSGIAWSLAWPVFILIWFHNGSIQSQVRHWN